VSRLVLFGIAAALALPGTTQPTVWPLRTVHAGARITVGLPAGWYLSKFPVADCVDPVQRFAASTRPASKLSVTDPLASGATLVVLTEDTVNDPKSFPARPAHFNLPEPNLLEGCCGMPNGPGYTISFRDHGRDFEAYVFARNLDTRAARGEAVAILDSLHIGRELQ
jgi:hypothetical protein